MSGPPRRAIGSFVQTVGCAAPPLALASSNETGGRRQSTRPLAPPLRAFYETNRRAIMKAKDVMTRQVISIAPDVSIFEALKLMLDHKISGLPVINKIGNLVGIVSEG